MKDRNKTRQELLDELLELRRRLAELEGPPAASTKTGGTRAGTGSDADLDELSRAKVSLKQRLQFEHLISRISTRFVRLPAGKVDEQIEGSLRLVGECLGIDRIAVLQFSKEGEELRLTHSFSILGGYSPPEFLVSAELPWFSGSLRRGKTIRISCIDDLPEEAAAERRYVKDQGIKSFLTIPMKVAGSPVGAISYDMECERAWPRDLIRQIQTVTEVLSNALDRKRSEKILIGHLHFERLISNLSARFASLAAEDLETHIEDALRLATESTAADRCSLWQFSEDGRELYIKYTWNVEGVEKAPTVLPIHEHFPWCASTLARGAAVVFSSPKDLPEEAEVDRKSLEKIGLTASVVIPIAVAGSYGYCLSLGVMRAKRSWHEELKPQLRLIGEVLVNALTRRKSEEKVRALMKKLEAENVYLREETERIQDSNGMLGDSAALGEVFRQVAQVATTDTTVLITGETGVGKELLARAIHKQSGRKGRPMVTVNCSALPLTLVEAELFGREKGAYTGSMTRQKGRFEIADGATLFLDEVGDLPPAIQPKLLRALQEGVIERLGSPREINVDVRLIAATNRDLKRMVADGSLRRDLFYRLNVFPIRLPPLRERREDIPELVWHFVRKYAARMGKRIDHIPGEMMQTLISLPWEGNIRELSNVIEHAVITSTQGSLRVRLPEAAPVTDSRGITLEAVERRHIFAVLEESRWKISGPRGAAERLGLKPTTLRSRMGKLGIRPKKSGDIS